MVYVFLKVLTLGGGSLGDATLNHVVFELREVRPICDTGGSRAVLTLQVF